MQKPRRQQRKDGVYGMAGMTYRRRFGDRKEGRLLRSLSPFMKLTPYIMVKRNDASTYFSDKMEVTETDRYLRAKRVEGYKGMGMLHLIIACYVRTIAQRPAINRFVSGQRIFARKNIQINMAVKRGLSADGSETTIKVEFEPTDTIFDVYRRLNEKIDEIKAGEEDNNTERVAGFFFKLPGIFLKFAIWFINLLDYFDLVPSSLLEASPFHGSMFITDLGSLGIPPVLHHLYNFGNLPGFIAFGAKRRVVEIDKQGRLAERKYLDYTVVSDERICDGSYYAAAFKYMRYLIANPQLLDKPPDKLEEDLF
jgi:hypothetical protein